MHTVYAFAMMLGLAALIQFGLAVGMFLMRERRTILGRRLGVALDVPAILLLLAQALVSMVLNRAAIDRGARASAKDRLQPTSEFGDSRPNLLVVLVRGTFAKGDFGDDWKELANVIRATSPRARLLSFYWPGRNSELDRRRQALAFADNISALAASHPGVPIMAMGHSHGGNVIQLGLRFLPAGIPIHGILIGTPPFELNAKELTAPQRRHIAALYASALIIPFFAAFLFGHVLAAAGYTWLRDAVDWIPLVVPVLVVGAVVLRPRVWAAREAILRPLPPLVYPVFRIWCRNDEIFEMFRRAEEVRRLTGSFADVTTQRITRLKAQPWLNFALQELVGCAAVFGIVWWAVSQTPEG
jgi:hypothetical protein